MPGPARSVARPDFRGLYTEPSYALGVSVPYSPELTFTHTSQKSYRCSFLFFIPHLIPQMVSDREIHYYSESYEPRVLIWQLQYNSSLILEAAFHSEFLHERASHDVIRSQKTSPPSLPTPPSYCSRSSHYHDYHQHPISA